MKRALIALALAAVACAEDRHNSPQLTPEEAAIDLSGLWIGSGDGAEGLWLWLAHDPGDVASGSVERVAERRWTRAVVGTVDVRVAPGARVAIDILECGRPDLRLDGSLIDVERGRRMVADDGSWSFSGGGLRPDDDGDDRIGSSEATPIEPRRMTP
jgi:hypothetical protein